MTALETFLLGVVFVFIGILAMFTASNNHYQYGFTSFIGFGGIVTALGGCVLIVKAFI